MTKGYPSILKLVDGGFVFLLVKILDACYLDTVFIVYNFTCRLSMQLLNVVLLVLDGALATGFLQALGQTLDNLHMRAFSNFQITTTVALR